MRSKKSLASLTAVFNYNKYQSIGNEDEAIQ